MDSVSKCNLYQEQKENFNKCTNGKKRNWEILTSYYFILLVMRRIKAGKRWLLFRNDHYQSAIREWLINVGETELSERRGSVWSRQRREQHCCEGLLGDIMQLLSFFAL